MRANLLLVFVANIMLAQTGNLDTTFGASGVVTTEASLDETEMKWVILQPDGKILAGGATYDHSGNIEYFIVRYNADGTPDGTFGDSGKVESNYAEGYTNLQDMQLQSTGKIVLKVYHNSTSFLLRYNTNGTLDTGFGVAGTLSLPNPLVASFTLMPNDKILISEVPVTDIDLGYRLYRYNANGTLDTGFGTGGFVFIPSVDGGNLYTVTLLDNGKKLLSGTIPSGGNTNIAIVRYKSNWTLDAAFGIGGRAIVNLDDTDVLNEIKIQDNDKILLAVYSYHAVPPSSFEGSDKLVRLKANGRIDNGFGALGLITPPIEPFALAIQSDGKIVVAGGIPYETGGGRIVNEVGLTRYRKNGNVDNSFGTSGIIRTQSTVLFGQGAQNLDSSLAIQSDGKMVLGAVFCEEALSCHRHSHILRYESGSGAAKESGIPKAITAYPSFTVYPNPVESVVHLDVNLAQQERTSVDLYDSFGKKICNLLDGAEIASGFSSQTLELPVGLQDGIYFVAITGETFSKTIKIIK